VKRADRRTRRRFLVPEVVQTSLMDCGPAALKAVLEGFDIDIGYEALRARCQTGIDGTSIDALAELASELGLESHEMLVPRDHFLVPEARCLPALVVARAGGGLFHFIVVWRRVGPYVQIMDPGGGRAWVREDTVLEALPDVEVPLTADRWRRWAASEDALAPLRARMRALGLGRAAMAAAVARAAAEPSWIGFGALDAGVRMLAALVQARGIARGAAARRLLEGLLDGALAPGADAVAAIPRRFWWASPAATAGKLTVRGPVIVHFAGRRASATQDPAGVDHPGDAVAASGAATDRATAPARAATPARALLALLCQGGAAAIGWLALLLVASALVAAADTVLLLGVLGAARALALDYQRASGIAAFAAFAAFALGLDVLVSSSVSRLGRTLETRLRVALLHKLPRLEDGYLQSRPTSDMASRGHQLQVLREVPGLAARVARACLALLVTTVAIGWLYPAGLGWAIGGALASAVVAWAGRRPLAELAMRFRTHTTALDRFYLDALLGATPIRVHGADRAVAREHEGLLVDWTRTGRSMHARNASRQALQALTGVAIAVPLVGGYLASGRPLPALLLLVVWAARLAASGQDLASTLALWRDARSVAIRLMAPLDAPEAPPAPAPAAPTTAARHGVRVELRGVTVRAGGTTILRNVDTTIASGSHVAIVGASGAGKSSLVGLLLGWHAPERGQLLVDDRPLDAAAVVALRRDLVWVDPSTQLWNRSLVDNVTFGGGEEALARLPEAMRAADLNEVLSGLGDGMRSGLGEGGTRLSGGQGQRVRLARALVRHAPRLVILDEAFRGLPRAQRRAMQARARERWGDATLLMVSHDVSDTVDLDRVLVVDDGAVVEDGAPAALLADPASAYSRLVAADAALRADVWSPARWQRRVVESGRVVAAPAPSSQVEVMR
jgi:ATP-binding cassette subfamily B protein